MVVSFGKRRTFPAMAVIAGGCMAIGSAPTMANDGTAATAAAAVTVIAPDEISQPIALEDGDTQFRQLFASWKSLDEGANVTGRRIVAPTASVSVPSRNPLARTNLTSSYGMRTHPVTGGRRRHKGIDLAAPRGTPIYATADGIVSKASRFSTYGLYVSIEHGGELQTRYAHMSRIAVAYGAEVNKGDIIGYVGSTGRSTGPHLHYEVRVAGRAVNPLPYMAESRAQNSAAGGRGGN